MGKTIFIEQVQIYGPDSAVPQLGNIFINAQGEWSVAGQVQADLLLNARRSYKLMPGLLDSHVHGQGGFDFSDVGANPDSISAITKAMGQSGLSYVFATIVSLDLPTLKSALGALNNYIRAQEESQIPGAATIVGVHLEGPFISKECKGAHAEKALQASISLELFRDIISAAPYVREWKITLAADLPGALEFMADVEVLEQEGLSVKIFLGHSNPSKQSIEAAIAAGAAGFTHLGNACMERCCRETRALEKKDAQSHLVQWVLEHPELCPAGVEVITDGVHISPQFIALLYEAIGDKMALVTDALGPTGLGEDCFYLGSVRIRREGSAFYLVNQDGDFIPKQSADGRTESARTLAGSASSMADCVRHYMASIAPQKTENALYSALVANARASALSLRARAQLQSRDRNNFVLFNEREQLVLSGCNGVVRGHAPLPFSKPEGGSSPRSSFFVLEAQVPTIPSIVFAGKSLK